jgi:hypothetical protein
MGYPLTISDIFHEELRIKLPLEEIKQKYLLFFDKWNLLSNKWFR